MDALEQELLAVGRHVEIPKVEVGGEVGQLAFGPGLEIDEPEVLVLYLSAHHHERASPEQKAQTSRSAGQREMWNGVGVAGRRHGFHREPCCAF